MISDKVIEQILSIRNIGKYNMLDIAGVQREAYENNYFELVMFLEENRKEYLNFIFTGQR